MGGAILTRDELFTKHKKLIYKVAHKHRNCVKGLPTYSYEDICQMASVGFLEACNSFDKDKGVPFVAYASKMMHWHINNALRNKKSVVKYPYYFEEIWKLASIRHCSYKEEDMKKLACESSYTYTQIKKAMRWYQSNSPLYLDGELEDGTNLYDMVSGEEFDETTAIVDEYLSSLTTKQKQVVDLLMEGKNQTEIGKELGISQQQVSRIVKSVQKVWLDNYA